jgi:hypothetical protein
MALDRDSSSRSMLLDFFKFCSLHPDMTQDLTYPQAPEILAYTKKNGWKVRRHGASLGRMYFAAPSQGEVFFLRMLLHVVKSPKGFVHLRTVQGHAEPFATFKEACVARGLLADSAEWHVCLLEAAGFHTGYQLRQLFATIICHNQDAEARSLFEIHFPAPSDDCVRAIERTRPANKRLQRMYVIPVC